ncbi:MAG: nucleotidyltransferase family protein [Anaerolineae bacterium]|nr:nucleotidyltransferase family protein [Anaerolineae bacterium]
MQVERNTDLFPYMAFWWQGGSVLPERELIAWLNGQRVLPLVIWYASQRAWKLSDGLMRAAQHAQYREQAQQMMAEQQLQVLGKLALSLNVPLVLVKGAAVAQMYPKAWMRSYTDIDLLVSEADLSRLVPAVVDLGYTWLESQSGERGVHLPPLLSKNTGVKLEIHTTLARISGRDLFTVEQWESGLQDFISFPGLRVPDSIAHALYLIHHAVIHHEFTLGLLPWVDLSFWTRTWGIQEWQQLSDRALAVGLQRAVCIAVALTRWVEDVSWAYDPLPFFPIPPSEILTMAQHIMMGEVTQKMPHLWRDMPERNLRGFLKYVSLVLMGDPKTRQSLPLRDRLWFYVCRPFHLLRNHGPALWRLLRGERTARKTWRFQQQLQSWLREAG